MASARKTRSSDPLLEAAVDYFASRSHDAWRKRLLQTNPKQKGKPRMRLRGGGMVDVNQPWTKLHPSAKLDNKRAAQDAYRAVQKFPKDREAAAAYVHECWIKRNKSDPNQSKALFKPYARLSETEKDKDRAHVDRMKKALAAVSKRGATTSPGASKEAPAKRAAPSTVQLDAKTWRRLEAAARELSALLGREVSPEAIANAGIEAMAALCKSVAAKTPKPS